MGNLKKGNLLGIAVGLFFAMSTLANAYTVTPPDPLATGLAGDATLLMWGDETGTDAIKDYIDDFYDISTSLYKDEVEGVEGETGSFAGFYETSFFNTTDEPSDADITWTGDSSTNDPFINADPTYLLVKDGKHNPSWYFFDITSWNGTDTLEIRNFWLPEYDPETGKKLFDGAISHVEIFGSQPIPEPATMLLFGTGLAGLAGFSRRKKK